MSGFTRPLDLAQQLVGLNGSPQHLGTIVATTAKDNSNTADDFEIPAGAILLLQSDTACYVKAQTAAATAVTAANGVLLAANEKFTLCLASDEAYVSCLAVTGTSNVKVWQLK